MLAPLIDNPRRQQIAQALAVPPPVGGWNTRDALDLMAPQDAILLDNLFPRTSDVILRKGRAVLSTTAMGSGDDVETMIPLSYGATEKMVSAAGGKIYDASGVTPSELGTGYTDDRWQWTIFSSTIFAVNGTDAPWKYDGSTFTSSTGFTGPTLTALIDVHSHANRLYFVEKDSTSFWYGGIDAVTSTLTEFDLKTIARHGGYLNNIGTITGDGSKDSRDQVCFFMSTGEVIVYEGDNPGDASAWQKVGSFKLAPPVGRHNLLEFGADLLCLTHEGLVPVARVLPMGRSRPDREILSDKIKGAMSAALEDYKDNAGWEITHFDDGDMILVNVPITASEFHQYVMNTNTGAWCRFKDWNGYAWTVHADKLYFGGGDGKVYQAWVGSADDGSAIEADGATAWNYFELRTQIKQFTLARAVFLSDGAVTHTMILNVDFDDTPPVFSVSSPAVGPVWDVAIWDAAIWFAGATTVQAWQSASNIGYVASLRIRLSTATQQVIWNSTTYQFTPGGLM